MFVPSESECMDVLMRALKDTQAKVDELEGLVEFYRDRSKPDTATATDEDGFPIPGSWARKKAE